MNTQYASCIKKIPRFTGYFLFAHIRQERHESRALDGLRKLPLMLGADTGMLRIDDLRLA